MVGVTGFEPVMTESKSVALPLGYTPMLLNNYIKYFQKNQEVKNIFSYFNKKYR